MTSAPQPPAGLFVPLVTPFTETGELDPAGLESLAHRVLDEGATGIVALGTTAEAPTLTGAERRRVLDICAQVCADRSAPLIAGPAATTPVPAPTRCANWRRGRRSPRR